ncbi:MAG: glutaredoxin [Verrucomicrobiales bacterium]|jgi:glutaredoxin
MTEPNELMVYFKPGCPWCIGVISHLKNEGFEFSEIDVLASEKAMEEMTSLSGQTLTPTLKLGELVLADAGVPELKKWLKKNSITAEMTQ